MNYWSVICQLPNTDYSEVEIRSEWLSAESLISKQGPPESALLGDIGRGSVDVMPDLGAVGAMAASELRPRLDDFAVSGCCGREGGGSAVISSPPEGLSSGPDF